MCFIKLWMRIWCLHCAAATDRCKELYSNMPSHQVHLQGFPAPKLCNICINQCCNASKCADHVYGLSTLGHYASIDKAQLEDGMKLLIGPMPTRIRQILAIPKLCLTRDCMTTERAVVSHYNTVCSTSKQSMSNDTINEILAIALNNAGTGHFETVLEGEFGCKLYRVAVSVDDGTFFSDFVCFEMLSFIFPKCFQSLWDQDSEAEKLTAFEFVFRQNN